ncbi:hypothetical protein Cgig2_020686 [Carnegiea gigantea]|uniref:Uncharacterized protein n=1 Tax=Carnegiea gigantea TaxID=171969 RepID=A0A9Q1JWJ7_9CARY|nr:hypothetical protein Cgig2_020686 [Carnegiea gigantea]
MPNYEQSFNNKNLSGGLLMTSTPGAGRQVAGRLVSVSSPLLAISGQTVPIQAETKYQSARFSSLSRTLSATVVRVPAEHQLQKAGFQISGFEALHGELSGDCKFPTSSSTIPGVRDEYQCLKLNASHSGVEVNDDALFLQATGGVNSKEEQLNATREELTRMKEEVKQTKDAIARIESRFGSSSS